jgi:hypothetical protein
MKINFCQINKFNNKVYDSPVLFAYSSKNLVSELVNDDGSTTSSFESKGSSNRKVNIVDMDSPGQSVVTNNVELTVTRENVRVLLASETKIFSTERFIMATANPDGGTIIYMNSSSTLGAANGKCDVIYVAETLIEILSLFIAESFDLRLVTETFTDTTTVSIAHNNGNGTLFSVLDSNKEEMTVSATNNDNELELDLGSEEALVYVRYLLKG